MSEISEKIKEDYRKNIKIRDVQFHKSDWDYTLIIKITDKNKKFFKNKTLTLDFFYRQGANLDIYVESEINEYINCKTRNKIEKLETFKTLQKYKKEHLEGEDQPNGKNL